MAFSLRDFCEPGDTYADLTTGERYTVGSAEIPARVDRFWIHASVVEDQPEVGMPFGGDTVGIVDEEEGGVFLYVHADNADAILAVLQGGGLYPPG